MIISCYWYDIECIKAIEKFIEPVSLAANGIELRYLISGVGTGGTIRPRTISVEELSHHGKQQAFEFAKR